MCVFGGQLTVHYKDHLNSAYRFTAAIMESNVDPIRIEAQTLSMVTASNVALIMNRDVTDD